MVIMREPLIRADSLPLRANLSDLNKSPRTRQFTKRSALLVRNVGLSSKTVVFGAVFNSTGKFCLDSLFLIGEQLF